MRSTATLALLLIAATVSAQTLNQEAVSDQPPLCGEDPGATTVRIDIDADAKTIYPKECTVAPGTNVVWWEDGDAVFETNFPGNSPDSSGRKKFKSAKVGNHNEAKFKAKNVNSRQTFSYDATINGEQLDPSVIVDPNAR